jgi:UPF0716 family protein affecting phage T7 exclusion
MDAMYLGYAALLMLAVYSLFKGCEVLRHQGATS